MFSYFQVIKFFFTDRYFSNFFGFFNFLQTTIFEKLLCTDKKIKEYV